MRFPLFARKAKPRHRCKRAWIVPRCRDWPTSPTTGAIDGARALRRTSIETLHDGCVDFAAQGRARFRKNPAVEERFARLPKDDQTFQETMTRAGAISAFCATLPTVGVPPAAFIVGQGRRRWSWPDSTR